MWRDTVTVIGRAWLVHSRQFIIKRCSRRRLGFLMFSSQPKKKDLFPCDVMPNCALVSNASFVIVIVSTVLRCRIRGRGSGNESCPASSISRGTKRKKKRPLRVIAIAGVTPLHVFIVLQPCTVCFDGFSPNSLLFSLSLFSNSLFLGCRNLSDRLPMLDDPSIIFFSFLKMEEQIARMVAPFWELLLITNPAFFCLLLLCPFFIWMTLLLLYSSWYRCTQF